MTKKAAMRKKKKSSLLGRGVRVALKAGAFAGGAAAAFFLAKEKDKTCKISPADAEKLNGFIEKQKAKESGE